MKTLLPLDPHHVPEILDLWSRRWGDQFPLDLALWQQNTDEDSRHFRAERCWVIEEDGVVRGCLALKVPDRPTAWPGQDPKHAWISVLVVEPGRDAELTEGLLDRALDWLRRAEFERVSYGGDPSHFFPGAPDDDRALRRMLETAGFRPGKLVYDLISDLGHHRVPEGLDRPLQDAHAIFGACNASDRQGLLQFVDSAFPGRWAYETRQRLEIEPTPEDILVIRRGAEIIGFCHAYHRGSRRLGPSVYWRRAIGDRYGGLGPLGLAPAFRGRGLGGALLAMAVGHLHRLGVERVVIDWTTLLDLYGRLGFQAWRTYRSWGLAL